MNYCSSKQDIHYPFQLHLCSFSDMCIERGFSMKCLTLAFWSPWSICQPLLNKQLCCLHLVYKHCELTLNWMEISLYLHPVRSQAAFYLASQSLWRFWINLNRFRDEDCNAHVVRDRMCEHYFFKIFFSGFYSRFGHSSVLKSVWEA